MIQKGGGVWIKAFLGSRRLKWLKPRYSKFYLNTFGLLLVGIGIVTGSYLTMSKVVIPWIKALTETSLSMPADIAFNRLESSGLAGYSDDGTYTVANEVRIATSSAWWDSTFLQKKPVTLRNLASASLSTGSAQITINTKELVDADKLQADCDDLRVVYAATASANRSEIPRSIQTASGATNCGDSTATIVTFPRQSTLWPSGGTDSNYELYYGNSGALTPSYPKEKHLSFDGGDYALSTGLQNVASSSAGTVEFWINMSQSLSSAPDMTFITWGQQDFIKWENSQQKIRYNTYNSSSSSKLIRASQNWIPNRWYHIAATWDQAQGLMILYFDGVEVGRVSGYVDQRSFENLYIGSGTYGEYINGFIDEVRVWNIALTSAQIEQRKDVQINTHDALWNNLIGYWGFNEGSGQVIDDSSKNNNQATLGVNDQVAANDPTWITGGISAYSVGDDGHKRATLVCPFNGTTTCQDGETPSTATGAIRYSGGKSALSFDGKNDYVDTGINSNNLTTPVTFLTWFKVNAVSNVEQSIFGAYVSGVNRWDVFYNRSNNGKVCWVYHAGQNICQDDLLANPSDWHLLVMVHTGSSVKFYLDGILKKESVTSYGITSGAIVKVGAGNTFLNGAIDEFAMYNRELSLEEVVAMYNGGNGKPLVPDTNTKLLYHFDENGDDPRNTGKAIDASGNGNHGTINGAKYVSGLVGVDASTTNTGQVPSGSYASHQGVFIEEGTTNLITNPSFEHATATTNWGPSHFTYATASATFTPAIAKRNSAGPFGAGPLIQGVWNNTSLPDELSVSRGTQISGNFYSNFDAKQGSIVLWVTPEWDGNDGKNHMLFQAGVNTRWSLFVVNGVLQFRDGDAYSVNTSISNWVAGATYSVVARWDQQNTLDGTNHVSLTINDGAPTFGRTTSGDSPPNTNLSIGRGNVGGGNGEAYAANAIIEGLTIYRRVLYDGQYGTDMGNGDEINQIASGGGKDPTLVTGSWDVVFALPTNATAGTLGTTGEAWSMPHSSNLLGGTNGARGYLLAGNATTDNFTTYAPNKLSNTGFETDLSSWSATPSYTLRDEFSDTLAAGSVNGSAATPGPGSRTVTDTGNRISMGSGNLTLSGAAGIYSDPLYYMSEGISRTAGRMGLMSFSLSDNTKTHYMGLNVNKTGYPNRLSNSFYSGAIRRRDNSSTILGSFSSNTNYQVAWVLKANGGYSFIKGGEYPTWTLLDIEPAFSDATLYLGAIQQSAAEGFTNNIDWARVPTATWLPTPLVYDTFARADGVIGSSETTGPDGQTTPSSVWNGNTWAVTTNKAFNTPVLGTEMWDSAASTYESGTYGWVPYGTNTIANVSNAFEITYVDNQWGAYNYFRGAGDVSSNLTVGNWYQYQVDAKLNTGGNQVMVSDGVQFWGMNMYDTTLATKRIVFRAKHATNAYAGVSFGAGQVFTMDNMSLKPLSLSELFSKMNTSDRDVIASVDVTLPDVSSVLSHAGIATNLNSVNSPTAGLVAYVGGGRVQLDKFTTETAWTNLISANPTYVPGAPLRVVTYHSDASTLKVRVYYNNALVGAEQTVTDAGIINGTAHGLFSTHSGNTFDNFSLFARGSDGEYNSIPAEELTATRETGTKYQGSASVKLVAGGNDANYLQSVNVGDAQNYTLSAYAYTTGAAVTVNDLELYAGTATISGTFTSVGSGWYRLDGTVAGEASSKNYGVRVKAGKTVYLDGLSLTPSTNSTTVSVMSTDSPTERIYAGGYGVTSDSGGGLYQDITVSAGQDVVIRGVAHADGSSQPKLMLYDQTNGTEIGNLVGTTTSTKSAPNVLLFTGEAPSGCTTIRVKLENAGVSGSKVYWHQVEVYENKINNPSLESGSGDPWIPTGWTNGAALGSVTAGQSLQETTTVHSGRSAIKFTETVAGLYGVKYQLPGVSGTHYGVGTWTHSGNRMSGYNNNNLAYQTLPTGLILIAGSGATSWGHVKAVGRVNNGGGFLVIEGNSRIGYSDDAYAVTLTPVTLSLTPANQANSTEVSGIRVDGADVLTQPITGLTTTNGVIKFKFTPRHSWSTAQSFGIAEPYFLQLVGNGDNYIILRKKNTTLELIGNYNGTSLGGTSASITLNAGTTYLFELTYQTGFPMTVKIDGTPIITTVANASTFTVTPNISHFGSNPSANSPFEGTIASFVTASVTENTTAPYYKFGSKSIKLVGYDRPDEYITTATTSANARNTISAFVYNGTTGAVGGTVDATVATIASGSASLTPTYNDMGGGWWRLVYTDPVSIPTGTYQWGVQVQPGKTIYVDGVQVEQNAYETTYADGSLGNGYAWSGTANASISTRTMARLTYPVPSGTFGAGTGTLSMWYKPNVSVASRSPLVWINSRSPGSNFNVTQYNTGFRLAVNDLSNQSLGSVTNTITVTPDNWYHLVATWNNPTNTIEMYVNGTRQAATTSAGTYTPFDENFAFGYQSDPYIPDALYSDVRAFDVPLTTAEIADLYYQGLTTHSDAGETDDRYESGTHTYTSPVIDLGAAGGWAASAWNATASLGGGTIAFATRTSPDNSTWSEWASVSGGVIASQARKYFQWKADMTASADLTQSPVIQGLNLTYVSDTTAPVNPGTTALGYINGASESATLTSGTWYNHPQPKFSWDAAGDTPDQGQSESGIDGYHVLLSSSETASPSASTGNPCYRFAEENDRLFTVGDAPAGCSLTDGTYYLRIQAKDNSGNTAEPTTQFTYRYDGSIPNAPSSIATTDVGYQANNSFTFYWPAANDNGPSGVEGYEYKTGTSSGTLSEWHFTSETTATGINAYQEGQNFFFVRTKDTAGNYSGSTSNNVATGSFYYNASAPTAPINVVISPSTSSGSPANANVFTVTWDRPASYSGEIAKYYYCVNCTPSLTTMTETTAAQTAERTLTTMALATQQGKNTFYIVAEDNNVNTDSGHGNRNFEAVASVDFYASTTAPGAPTNLTITDASDRDTNIWRLTLAWNAPSTGGTPARYEVYRSTNNTTYSKLGEITTTAFTDTNLSQGSTYSYKVLAVDNAGSQSLFSNVVSKVPEGRYNTPPAAGGVPSVEPGSTTATVTWATSRNAFGTVEYGKDETYGKTSGEMAAVTAHSVKVSGLAPGTTYHFRVQNLDESDMVGYDRSEAYSADYTFTTLNRPDITEIKVDDVGLNSAVVSWKTASLATSKIEYGTTTSYGTAITVSTTPNESIHTARLTGLTHSTTYHFRVRGTTADSEDIYSEDNTLSTLTFPKVTAMVFNTDKANSGTAMVLAWSTNVPTTSEVVVQAAEIDIENAPEAVVVDTPSGKQVNLKALQAMEQTELLRLPVVPKGEPRSVSDAKLSLRHVQRIANLSDGSLYIFTLRGRDQYGHEAVSEPVRYVTGADTKPPTISEVVVETPMSGVGEDASAQLVVSFKTDEPAQAQILWGTGTGNEYPQTTEKEGTQGLTHVFVIRGLEATTTYHFKIQASDTSLNLAESADTVVVTPAAEQAAFDLILKNLEDIFGFLKL